MSDPKLFLLNYFNFCELDCSVPSTFNKVVNQNPKTTKIKVNFSKEQITTINQYITNFSKIANRDVSHWLR